MNNQWQELPDADGWWWLYTERDGLQIVYVHLHYQQYFINNYEMSYDVVKAKWLRIDSPQIPEVVR